MKFNISLVSLMHAVNNQCQIKISFQPCFFHWLLETKSHRYLSLLCSIHHSSNFPPCIFTKAISKKNHENLWCFQNETPVPRSYLFSSVLLFLLTLFSITHEFGNPVNGITPLQVSATAIGKAFMPLQKGKDLYLQQTKKTSRFRLDHGQGERKKEKMKSNVGRHLHRHRAGGKHIHQAWQLWADPTPSWASTWAPTPTPWCKKGKSP